MTARPHAVFYVTIQKHQRHAFSLIEEVYLSAEKNLDHYVRELKTDVKPSLEAMNDSLKQQLHNHEVQIEKVKDEINLFRQTLKQKVDESCDTLQWKLDQTKKKKDFRKFEIEFESSKQKIDQLIKDVEIMIGEGKLDIIDYNPPNPQSLIPKFTMPVLKSPNFVPGNDLISMIQYKIGKIEFKEPVTDDMNTMKGKTSPNRVLEGESKEKTPSGVKCIEKSDIKIIKVKSFQSKPMVTSLTAAGNDSAWVMCLHNDTMYRYDSNGDVIRSVKVEDDTGIYMVITRSGDMIVTFWDNKVRRVSVCGKVSTLINTESYEPEGVCLTDKEEIVLCMRGSHVAVYSPDGRSKLRDIRGVDRQGEPQMKTPYRVVFNCKDLYVVNLGGNVVFMDESDNVRWMYDGKQAGLGKLRVLFDPRGICVDKYHNLLVTDYFNHCVHYIDRDGLLIQVILTQKEIGVQCPWGICVDDETGHVWIGNRCRNVVLALYLK